MEKGCGVNKPFVYTDRP